MRGVAQWSRTYPLQETEMNQNNEPSNTLERSMAKQGPPRLKTSRPDPKRVTNQWNLIQEKEFY